MKKATIPASTLSNQMYALAIYATNPKVSLNPI